MNTENGSASPSSRRRFGAPSLALAIVATAVARGRRQLAPRAAGRRRITPTRGAARPRGEGAVAVPDAPEHRPGSPGRLPDLRDEAREGGERRRGGCAAEAGLRERAEGAVAVPDAPEHRPGPPGRLPDLRHEARQGGGRRRSAGSDAVRPPPRVSPASRSTPRASSSSASRSRTRSAAPVGGSWRTSGRVAVDETRVHHVNVKFSGFMEHVHANFVGRPVKAGEPLFSIYSPELLAAQQEYLLALDTRKRLADVGRDDRGRRRARRGRAAQARAVGRAALGDRPARAHRRSRRGPSRSTRPRPASSRRRTSSPACG